MIAASSATFTRVYRTAPRVEERIVFHARDRRLNRIERGTVFLEHRGTGIQRAPQRCTISRVLRWCERLSLDNTRAAVYGDRPLTIGFGKSNVCEHDQTNEKDQVAHTRDRFR
jgi:hypothetical protein